MLAKRRSNKYQFYSIWFNRPGLATYRTRGEYVIQLHHRYVFVFD